MTIQRLRIKKSAPWLARMALFALLFQISAIDHHTHPSDVIGVLGSSNHQMHCHGAVGSCANSGGEMPAALMQPATLPTAPSLMVFAPAQDFNAPIDAELEIGSEPPRA